MADENEAGHTQPQEVEVPATPAASPSEEAPAEEKEGEEDESIG